MCMGYWRNGSSFIWWSVRPLLFAQRICCQWIGDGIQLQPHYSCPNASFSVTFPCLCNLSSNLLFHFSPYPHFKSVAAASNAALRLLLVGFDLWWRSTKYQQSTLLSVFIYILWEKKIIFSEKFLGRDSGGMFFSPFTVQDIIKWIGCRKSESTV